MHLQSPRNVLLGEHCSPESSHSNGSWRVTGARGRPRFLWSTKSYNQKSREEQAACIWDKKEFLKYFILLGMLGTRSPSDTVQAALRVSFLSLDFFPFAAVLDPQCKTHLGQTESSQPLSSSLCRARKNTGVLSVCCDREQLGKIWGSDRGFGSTFRKQKAERQRGVEFQTLPAGTGAHSRLFLTSFLPPKGSLLGFITDSLIWCRDISTWVMQLWSPPPPRTWRIRAGCPKGAGMWTKSDKKQQKAALRWQKVGIRGMPQNCVKRH